MPAEQLRRTACMGLETVRQNTLLAMMEVGTKVRSILESIGQQNWYVSDFDAANRVACVIIAGKKGLRYISITIPPFGTK